MQNGNSRIANVVSVGKGVGVALAFSLLATIIFACVLRITSIPDKAVYPVLQTLKILGVVLGSALFIKGEKGWLKGGAVGLIFTALSYVTFSSIGGDFSLSWWFLVELVACLFAGVLSGVLAVNLKRSA